MALIGEMQYLTIGGNTYSIPTSGGSTVSVTRTLTSGTKTATISVDGTSYDLYAPTPNVGTITSVKTTAGVHTTINVSSGSASFNVPTKTSHLTNDSGFITSHQDISGKVNKTGDTMSGNLTFSDNGEGIIFTYGTNTSQLGSIGNDGTVPIIGFDKDTVFRRVANPRIDNDAANKKYVDNSIKAITETDPIFSASPAAGITSTDISNWNAKVSDTGKWDDVTLDKNEITGSQNLYLPCLISTTETTAKLVKVLSNAYTANSIVRRNSDGYIISKTPSANDNSTKVATTEYVTNAIGAISIPTKTSDLTNDGDGTSAFATLADIGSFGGGTVTSITLKAGSGITLDTDNTAITTSGTRTISHADTSSQSSITATSRTYVTGVTLDTYGHVTGLTTGTETVTNTDTKLEVAQIGAGTTNYIIMGSGTTAATRQYDTTGLAYTRTTGVVGDESQAQYARIILGNGTSYTTSGGARGAIRLYGTRTNYTDLISGIPTANRTITLPNKDGTVALTSDIPTVPTNISAFTNDAGYLTSYTETDPTVPSWAKASTKPTYTASEVGALPDTTTIPSIILNGTSINSPSFYAPTSAGTDGYVLKSNGSGAPTWTSATLTDTQVTSTAVTAATTNYLVGSTTSTTITGGLSKHASGVLYTTANSGTSGYTQLRLGNTTATTSAGGKEGQIRLYGTNATYYLDLKPGAIASSNKTITFPNKTGTVALTDDIPTISYPVTSVNNKTGAVSLTASDVGALPSTTTIPSITLNGSSTTSPSFYAPTSGGTSGYYLKSTGNGAPTWAAISITDTKNTAGSTNSSSKLYLIGATEQSANPQTYSNSRLYYSNGLSSDAISNESQSYIEQDSTSVHLHTYTANTGEEASIYLDDTTIAISSSDSTVSISGNGVYLYDVVTPTSSYMAANKKYVDDNKGAQVQIVRW